MTKEEKVLLTKVLYEQLPYGVKVAIDFQSYIAWLPDDKNLAYPYRKNLNFILDYDKKTIEDISKEPNIVYSYPCAERFQMLRGYTYQEDYGVPVEFIKPYLRPLPSMTESEARGIAKLYHISDSELLDVKVTVDGIDITLDDNFCSYEKEFIRFDEIVASIEIFDYLNAKHFDIRGLIPMGLAIAAIGENNPYKEKGGEE